METSQLRAIQNPNRATVLVESWVSSQNIIPAHAYRVSTLRELSPPLRRLARSCNSGGSVWAAWADVGHTWFVAAVPSLELARERKKPVLQITVYDEDGDVTMAEHFVYTMSHGWQKCT